MTITEEVTSVDKNIFLYLCSNPIVRTKNVMWYIYSLVTLDEFITNFTHQELSILFSITFQTNFHKHSYKDSQIYLTASLIVLLAPILRSRVASPAPALLQLDYKQRELY